MNIRGYEGYDLHFLQARWCYTLYDLQNLSEIISHSSVNNNKYVLKQYLTSYGTFGTTANRHSVQSRVHCIVSLCRMVHYLVFRNTTVCIGETKKIGYYQHKLKTQ